MSRIDAAATALVVPEPVAAPRRRLKVSLGNPTGAATWPTTLITALVLVFLLLPTVIVIPVSFGSERYLQFPPKEWSLVWYRAYFDDPEWMSATGLSLLVAFLATLVATAIALPATLAFARGRLPGGGILKGLILAPMILPHIVVAVALYITFSKWGLTGTVTGFVAAHAVLALPFLFLTISAAITKLDPSLEMAAASLGASNFSAFRLVTLPLLLPALAGGMAFAFITSLDEAVVSNFLSSSTQKLLMKKMFEDIDFDVSPVIAAVSTLIVVGSFTLIGLAQLLQLTRRKRTG
jgi:mannopine transport system permease protein